MNCIYIHKLNIVFLCTSMHDDHEYSCCNCILVTFRVKAVKCTDRRVRGMTDILSGIKVLKMYAWENVFKKMIFNIRRSVIYSTCRATLFIYTIMLFLSLSIICFPCAGRK